MKFIDKLLNRIGYVPKRGVITGTVEWKREEPEPFVDLTIPGGQRVYGWVDNRIPWAHYRSNNVFVATGLPVHRWDPPGPVAIPDPSPLHPSAPAIGRNGRWEKIGRVGVDGGRIGISDPVYVDDEAGRPKPIGLNAGMFREWGSGVEFLAGFGDGLYDVWAWIADYGAEGKPDERIAQIVVTLIDAEDLTDWQSQP